MHQMHGGRLIEGEGDVDIKRLRERTSVKLTQEQLARMLGVSQAQISRYESNPAGIPAGVLLEIAAALGASPSDVLRSTVPTADLGPIDAGDPYAMLRRYAERLDKHLSYAPRWAVPPTLGSCEATGSLGSPFDGVPLPADLACVSARLRTKPIVALAGPFDAGKSSFINVLLGTEALPTRYQPTTRVVTYVRHVDDRPAWLRENVWILGSGFDPRRWEERDHVTTHRIVAGSLDTLNDYGTHSGVSADAGATYALLFLDAPVLRSCTLLDTPGFENDTDDTAKAQSALDTGLQPDVLIYMHPYIGFLPSGDLVRIGHFIRRMPQITDDGKNPLANIFLVASHASPATITDDEVAGLLGAASDRAMRQWGSTLFASDSSAARPGVTSAQLRRQFFSFYRSGASARAGNSSRGDDLLGTITSLLAETLPAQRLEVARRDAHAALDAACDNVGERAATVRRMVDGLEAYRAEYDFVMAQSDNRRARVVRERLQVEDQIVLLSQASAEELKAVFAARVNVDAVTELIRSRFEGRKDAQQNAAAFLQEQLVAESERICLRHATTVNDNISNYLATCKQVMRGPSTAGPVMISLDPTGAFVGGAFGGATVGALALWASTLGNLGAYIIAAKAASVLSALGISFTGGAATLTSALAAVGGPLTVAVAIVVVAAVIGYALISESWERRLAKALVKYFERNLHGAMLQQMADFWTDTREAFLRGAEAVDDAWEKHLDGLRVLLNEGDERRRSFERLTELHGWFLASPRDVL